MPKVTSVYHERLVSIPGKFENEVFGCTVELEDDDSVASAFKYARFQVSEQILEGKQNQDWKGMYERTKNHLENLAANHSSLMKKFEQYKDKMAAISVAIGEEAEIPF